MSTEDDAKSVESMDSFVRDAPQPVGQGREEDCGVVSPLTVSEHHDLTLEDARFVAVMEQQQSAASKTMVSSTPPNGELAALNPPPPRRSSPTPSLGTINSQTGSIPPAPAHNFFQTLGYEQDSDASAASLVFQPSTTATTSSQASVQGNRTRLHSYESAGSTNSLRLISPRSRQQQIQLHHHQRQPMTPNSIKPHLLPYSERRKLLQQRQKQKQQQQSSPYNRQPQQQQPLQAPYHAYPTHPGMPYPPQVHVDIDMMQGSTAAAAAPQLPPYPAMGMPPYPMQQQPPAGQLQPYPAAPSSSQQGYPPPPQPIAALSSSPQARHVYRDPSATLGTGNTATASSRPAATQQQQRRFVPRPPQATRSASAPIISRSRTTESHESSSVILNEEPQPPPAGLGYQLRAGGGSDVMPPPPPPVSFLPPGLVRQGSAGSVSSLGSMDRSGRESPTMMIMTATPTTTMQQSAPDPVFAAGVPMHQAHAVETDVSLYYRPQEPAAFDEFVPPSLPELQPGELYRESYESPQQSLHSYPAPQQHEMQPSLPQEALPNELPQYGAISDRVSSSQQQQRQLKKPHDEVDGAGRGRRRRRTDRRRIQGDDGSSSYISSSDVSDSGSDRRLLAQVLPVAHERTRLLPTPSGASTSEMMDKKHTDERRQRHQEPGRQVGSARRQIIENRQQPARYTESHGYPREAEHRPRRKQQKKKRKQRQRSYNFQPGSDASNSSLTSHDSASKDHWMGRRQRMLDIERARLIRQWKAEARAEAQANNMDHDCCYQLYQTVVNARDLPSRCSELFLWIQPLIANLPVTIGAIALAIANLGIDWFKFVEEHDPHCMSVHFHSASQCSFPDSPGCYYCDVHTDLYKFAAAFRLACSIFGGILALAYIGKLIFFHRIVFDELSSPTTAAPVGLICAALTVVFAGRGLVGMVMVSIASIMHLCLAIWFIYMTLAYRILPEPSWFPNTVVLGISALKTWLYFPDAGHFLMAVSLSLNFFFFPASLVRIALNKKIKAPSAWMLMTAPNISLYAMTIMAQPSFLEEHPDVTNYQKIHRELYLPCMHFLFGLVMAGMVASVTSLIVRWKQFRKAPFSPVHAAFCSPCLYHANSIQAYRASVISFSGLPSHHPYCLFLSVYWTLSLLVGTVATVGIASRFLWCLGSWTHFEDALDEPEPPAPYETTMTLSNLINTGDTLVQSFVSPAILQSNETGLLVLSRDVSGSMFYRRSRDIPALGFEPVMSVSEMEMERELLADFVGKNPPRHRQRSLSVPGIDFSYGYAETASVSDLESSTPQKRRDWRGSSLAH